MAGNDIVVRESFAARTQTCNSEGVLTSCSMTFLAGLADPNSFILEDAALAAVQAASPATAGALVRESIGVSERLASNLLKVSVTYTSLDHSYKSKEEEEVVGKDTDSASNFSGEISSSVEHVNYGKILKSFGTVPPNVRGALGLDEEGNATGIDRECASPRFTETHTFSRKKFNSSYFGRLISMKDSVNKAAFRGFAAGEVKFSGVSFQRNGRGKDAKYVVTFTFDVRKNEKASRVDGIAVPAKRGWDVVCPYIRSCVDNYQGSPHKTTRMTGGWIAEVYPSADFKALKIGTGSF